MSRRPGRNRRNTSFNRGEFTPADLGGLVLWLRSDLGITLNATQVSAWADQSGQGNHFTQATGAVQPTYVASETDFPTPRPAVKFDQSQDRLDAAAAWAVRYVAIVGVYNGATFAAFNTLLGSTGAVPTRRFFIGASGTANWRKVDVPSDTATYARDGTSTDVALTSANAPHLWEAEWGSDVTPTTGWRLGADGAAVNEWTDSVAEVIMTNAVPSASQRAALKAYIAARYGITVA